jgi:hypothetical protein
MLAPAGEILFICICFIFINYKSNIMNHLKNINCFFILFAFLLTNCTNPNNESNSKNTTELKTGGLYLFKNKDSTYYVSKILVLDDFAAHVRTYQNKFSEKT